MRVLFVSSGNKNSGPGIIILNQAESLKKLNISLDHFAINARGFSGYYRNVFILRSYLRNNKFDIVHAHYSLSAIVATFAGARPLVVSLMGSDARLPLWNKFLILLFSRLCWKATIIKEKNMFYGLSLKHKYVIPNGVDLEKITPKRRHEDNSRTVLFAADPNRESKNFHLAFSACNMLNDSRIILKTIFGVPHDEIISEINNADVILLTSKWEGSPNIVKEAMACNRPVVATNVGDVKWLFGSVPGYYLTSFEPSDVADKIQQALRFSEEYGTTKGREQISKLGLDSVTIARRLTSLYKAILSNER